MRMLIDLISRWIIGVEAAECKNEWPSVVSAAILSRTSQEMVGNFSLTQMLCHCWKIHKLVKGPLFLGNSRIAWPRFYDWFARVQPPCWWTAQSGFDQLFWTSLWQLLCCLIKIQAILCHSPLGQSFYHRHSC